MSNKINILRFKFDDFASLPSASPVRPRAARWWQQSRSVSQEMTDINGNKWCLELYPKGGGHEDDDGDDGDDDDDDDPWVSCFLANAGNEDITAKCSIIVRDSFGNSFDERQLSVQLYEAGESWGGNLAVRAELLDKEKNVLLNGALIIDVHIQTKPKPKSLLIPANPFASNMLKLLENEGNSDVSFMVKKTIIPAHKLILEMNAPLLYDFCEGHKRGKSKHVPIKDVTPKIFRMLLRYIYGGDPPDSVTIEMGKDLIVAADKYGIIGLKLAVETTLVEALMLDNENVADWILFADSMNCPLLKEHATSYFVARAVDLVDSEDSAKLKESPKIMDELMKEVSRGLVNDSRYAKAGRNMSVNDLRKKLDGEGLDIDGSKETLISRLNNCNKRQRTG